MKSTPPQLSFASGEVSPLLGRRTDYQRQQTGLARCRGFLPLKQGPVTRAPGTLRLGATLDDRPAQLIPFEFNRDDALTLEFTPNRMRVWRYGALVMDGGAPFELSTVYEEADIGRLQAVQTADVIYMVTGRGTVAPRKLSRFALDDWTLERLDPRDGPFAPGNGDESSTVEVSALTGSITVTASEQIFDADDVGRIFRIEPEGQETPTWAGNAAVSVGDFVVYDGNTYECVVAGTLGDTGPNPPIHTSGRARAVKNGPIWKWVSNGTGIVRITGFTNKRTVTAQVLVDLHPELTGATTWRWAHGAWGGSRGWPSAIALHQQRLVFAATDAQPRTIWFSAIGGFEEFREDVTADAAFAYQIAGTQSLNRIEWLQSGDRGLHVGAQGEVYSSRSSTAGEALSIETAVFEVDATIGVSETPPVAPDGRPIFIDRSGRRVHELRYRFSDDAVEPVELSLPAAHLGDSPFRQIVWIGQPQRMALLRRADGLVAVLVHDPAEEVLGWGLFDVGGICESMAVTVDAAGTGEDVLMVVRRGAARHVCRLAPVWATGAEDADPADAVHLTLAVQATNTATVSGLSHLEGATVHAWTEQGPIGPLTVSGGSVALGLTCAKATVGLDPDGQVLRTWPAWAAVPNGDSLGRRRDVKHVGLALHRTVACEMRAIRTTFDREDAIDWRMVHPSQKPVTLQAARSGVVRVPVSSGAAEDVSLEFRPVPGAPFTLAAVAPSIEVEAG